MRQGQQQNRRGRGRPNNNNRGGGGGKGQNPLTRSFESNGPDVKIRGTPSHVAEKYVALARDALSNGDVVMAENYLQHAEHYNRIIMTYREQQQEQAHASGGQPPRQQPRDQAREQADSNTQSADAAVPGQEPQPVIDDQFAARDDAGTGGPPRGRRGPGERRPRQPRQPRGDRTSAAGKGERGDGGRAANGNRNGSSGGEGARIADGPDAPGFLRNSVAPAARRRRSTPAAVDDDAAPAKVAKDDSVSG